MAAREYRRKEFRRHGAPATPYDLLLLLAGKSQNLVQQLIVRLSFVPIVDQSRGSGQRTGKIAESRTRASGPVLFEQWRSLLTIRMSISPVVSKSGTSILTTPSRMAL